MIDLSQFVDKKVRVTFRNIGIFEGKITRNTTGLPYCFKCDEGDYECDYTYDGFLEDFNEPTAGDIIQIEEIKSMNKYEELEKQVAEMQKEIDRLKAQEKKKKTFENDIRSILVRDTQLHRHRIDYLTQKICETVENYIPKLFEVVKSDSDAGYNIAIRKIKQNLGLNK